MKASNVFWSSTAILELVRTGMVALERGSFTIAEQTNEKSEFELGKTVI